MPPMSVGLLNRPQLLTFLWWQPNKPNARCWRSWNNQTCRCIHRRSKPLLRTWVKLQDTKTLLSKQCWYKSSCVTTCKHLHWKQYYAYRIAVQNSVWRCQTEVLLTLIARCSHTQLQQCVCHPALTPSLYCIQTLSQSITGAKSFVLPLLAPNNDGGRITEFHTTLHICLQAADMSEGLKPYGCECSASASSSIYPTTTSF